MAVSRHALVPDHRRGRAKHLPEMAIPSTIIPAVNSLRTAKRFMFPLLGLWVLLYASFSLVKPPLLDGEGSVQAEAAREMAVNGDWITPHLNGVRFLAVSPLLTWSTAASFKLFGVADWAARLPLAFYALALFLITLALGARLFLTPVAGFYAALILLTSVGIFLFAHQLYPQILATLWLTLAMYFFWRSLHHKHASLGTAIGFAASCAFEVMSQGRVGMIVPAIIVLLFLAITRNLFHLLRWHPIISTLVFLLIAVPWHVAIHRANSFHPVIISGPGLQKCSPAAGLGIHAALDHAVVLFLAVPHWSACPRVSRHTASTWTRRIRRGCCWSCGSS